VGTRKLDGDTTLTIAARSGHAPVVSALLAHDIHMLSSTGAKGHSSLSAASQNGSHL